MGFQGGAGPAITEWTNYTQTIIGETTNPTKGTTNVDTASFKVIGKTLYLKWGMNMTGAGVGGTGDYRFTIPAGFTIDTTKVSQDFGNLKSVVGVAFGQQSNATQQIGVVTIGSTTEVKLFFKNGATTGVFAGSTFFSLVGADTSYSFSAELPIL